MTDNEIKKALECCADHDNIDACDDCPCLEGKCISTTPYVLDLINRQQAEIERLQSAWFKKEETMQMIAKEKQQYFDELQTARAEAIKEFAERLDDSLCKNIGPSRKLYWKISADIDNLVKEMVGESK